MCNSGTRLALPDSLVHSYKLFLCAVAALVANNGRRIHPFTARRYDARSLRMIKFCRLVFCQNRFCCACMSRYTSNAEAIEHVLRSGTVMSVING